MRGRAAPRRGAVAPAASAARPCFRSFRRHSQFAGVILIAAGTHSARDVGIGLVAAYLALVVVSALLAGARFRSALTALFTVPALIATQAVYVAGFVRGLAHRR